MTSEPRAIVTRCAVCKGINSAGLLHGRIALVFPEGWERLTVEQVKQGAWCRCAERQETPSR